MNEVDKIDVNWGGLERAVTLLSDLSKAKEIEEAARRIAGTSISIVWPTNEDKQHFFCFVLGSENESTKDKDTVNMMRALLPEIRRVLKYDVIDIQERGTLPQKRFDRMYASLTPISEKTFEFVKLFLDEHYRKLLESRKARFDFKRPRLKGPGH